jgi:hypothetical protein
MQRAGQHLPGPFAADHRDHCLHWTVSAAPARILRLAKRPGVAPSARLRRLSGRAEHWGCTRAVLGILELQPLPLVVSAERIVIGIGLGALDRATL